MQQLNLLDYRADYLEEFENQIVWYCDVLKETKNTITYSENIVPHKGKAICRMEYEEYIDIKKNNLGKVSYDEILKYLKNAKKEDKIARYKVFLKFKNIPFEADLFSWHNEDLN
jgi:hypothetical protein